MKNLKRFINKLGCSIFGHPPGAISCKPLDNNKLYCYCRKCKKTAIRKVATI